MAADCCSSGELAGCDAPPVVGAVARILLHLIDSASCEPFDAGVVARVRLPDGTTSTPAAEHDSLGEFHADWTVSQAGQHFWRFEIASDPATVVEGAFLAAASPVLA